MCERARQSKVYVMVGAQGLGKLISSVELSSVKSPVSARHVGVSQLGTCVGLPACG